MINDRFAGTAFLDILIETPAPDGLLDADVMAKITALQSTAEALPHVQKSIAITDYLSLMHTAIESTDVRGHARPLPADSDSIAQYLLLYEISGDPSDFEEEIDYDYQHALLRVVLDTPRYSESRSTVERLQQYLDVTFNDETVSATLAGDVAVGFHWMRQLEQSHFQGVLLSLTLVLLAATLLFRSVTAGVAAVVPVSFSVLVLYAVMGYTGIHLEPATSMFAAIALGVGVDFGIHLVERLRNALRAAPHTAAEIALAAAPTARACFFNSAALGVGFAVLLFSDLPTLERFGALISVATLSSFAAAMLVIPALFAAGARRRFSAPGKLSTRTASLLLILGGVFLAAPADASGDIALTVARQVADRPEADAAERHVRIVLTNRRGKVRERTATILRQRQADVRLTRITYTAPKSIRDTAFLSHDYDDLGQDSRWFYLPAAQKVRRVPANSRGDYFLGTDFTYEDIQSELRFNLDDYDFSAGQHTGRDDNTVRLNGTPKSDAIAKQLGYGGFEALIDTTS